MFVYLLFIRRNPSTPLNEANTARKHYEHVKQTHNIVEIIIDDSDEEHRQNENMTGMFSQLNINP